MSDPVPRLLRALIASALKAGSAVTLTHLRQTPWATATFVGARHTLSAVAEPAALSRWLTMLPEAELPLPGHFVASCAAEGCGGHATIELLVLEQ